MKILGILNITSDSFSDGGRYLEPGAALFHAEAMAQVGADIIDIGAASSNPDAQSVTPEVEIARLGAVVPKRHARRAVTRNLLKRQIRRVVHAQPGLPSGLWVVRLRSPFDRKLFPSAASDALRSAAGDELLAVIARAARSGA